MTAKQPTAESFEITRETEEQISSHAKSILGYAIAVGFVVGAINTIILAVMPLVVGALIAVAIYIAFVYLVIKRTLRSAVELSSTNH